MLRIQYLDLPIVEDANILKYIDDLHDLEISETARLPVTKPEWEATPARLKARGVLLEGRFIKMAIYAPYKFDIHYMLNNYRLKDTSEDLCHVIILLNVANAELRSDVDPLRDFLHFNLDVILKNKRYRLKILYTLHDLGTRIDFELRETLDIDMEIAEKLQKFYINEKPYLLMLALENCIENDEYDMVEKAFTNRESAFWTYYEEKIYAMLAIAYRNTETAVNRTRMLVATYMLDLCEKPEPHRHEKSDKKSIQ